jgi:hypothetical protein
MHIEWPSGIPGKEDIQIVDAALRRREDEQEKCREQERMQTQPVEPVEKEETLKQSPHSILSVVCTATWTVLFFTRSFSVQDHQLNELRSSQSGLHPESAFAGLEMECFIGNGSQRAGWH